MVVLTLAMKIAGFSDYYRQFKDRYTAQYAETSEGKHFGRKSFGVDKNPVFRVANANTYYIVMNNVVAITHFTNVVIILLTVLWG